MLLLPTASMARISHNSTYNVPSGPSNKDGTAEGGQSKEYFHFTLPAVVLPLLAVATAYTALSKRDTAYNVPSGPSNADVGSKPIGHVHFKLPAV